MIPVHFQQKKKFFLKLKKQMKNKTSFEILISIRMTQIITIFENGAIFLIIAQIRMY